MIRIRNLSMSTKISFMAILGVALFGAVIISSAVSVMTEAMTENAFAKLSTSLGIANSSLHQYGDDFEIRDGKLMIGSKDLTGNNEVIDGLVEICGGVMTIFQDDTRVATNIVKDDGTRAVGTKLAAGPIHDAIFKEGKPYRGESNVLGKVYFGAYNPISDRTGKTIGIMFTGMNKAEHMVVINNVIPLALEELALRGC